MARHLIVGPAGLTGSNRCKGCIGYGANATKAGALLLHQGPLPAPAQETQHGRQQPQGPGRIHRDGHSTSPHRACRQRKGGTDAARCCIRVPCAVVCNGVGHRRAVCAERGATELEPGGCSHCTTHGRRRRAVLPELDACRQRLGIGDGHRHCAGTARGLECVLPIGHRCAHRGGVGQAGKTAGGFERASSATSRKRCRCRA